MKSQTFIMLSVAMNLLLLCVLIKPVGANVDTVDEMTFPDVVEPDVVSRLSGFVREDFMVRKFAAERKFNADRFNRLEKILLRIENGQKNGQTISAADLASARAEVTALATRVGVVNGKVDAANAKLDVIGKTANETLEVVNNHTAKLDNHTDKLDAIFNLAQYTLDFLSNSPLNSTKAAIGASFRAIYNGKVKVHDVERVVFGFIVLVCTLLYFSTKRKQRTWSYCLSLFVIFAVETSILSVGPLVRGGAEVAGKDWNTDCKKEGWTLGWSLLTCLFPAKKLFWCIGWFCTAFALVGACGTVFFSGAIVGWATVAVSTVGTIARTAKKTISNVKGFVDKTAKLAKSSHKITEITNELLAAQQELAELDAEEAAARNDEVANSQAEDEAEPGSES